MELLKSAVFFLLAFAVVSAVALFVQGQGLKYLGPKVAAYKARTASAEARHAITEEPSFVEQATVTVGDDGFSPDLTDVWFKDDAAEVNGTPSIGEADVTASILSTKYSHIILDKRINARLFICHRERPVAELRVGCERIKEIPFLKDESMLEMAGHFALKAYQAQAARAA